MKTKNLHQKYKLNSAQNFCAYFLVAIFFIFFSFPVKAQTAQDAITQQDWITRQQQNILEEKKRSNEFETIKKEHERKKKEEEEEAKKSQPSVTGKAASCFPITEIHLLDANSLSNYRKKKIVAPFIGKCLEAEVLAAIIKAVNDYYQSQGFVTTQVKVPKQNLQNGIFELQIIEGKVEEISLGKDRVIEKMQEFTAFGSVEGETLNINDINQGMYQLNRLQSNQAVMKIQPGSVSGDSKVVIDNNKKFPAHFTVGKDNLGNNFTGIQRVNFSSNFDNLLFLNDNLNLSYTNNIHDNSQSKDIKSFSTSLSIPFKYNTFSYDYYRSEFTGRILPNGVNTKQNGYSQQSKFSLDRVLLNRSDFRLSVNSSLAAKSTATYQDARKQPTSERKLSIINIGFSISSYLNQTTNIYLKPSYSKGLKILNAKQDPVNEKASDFKAQFEVFKLYANFSKKFTIPKINAPLTLSTEMDNQYAKQTLYGSEQFSVGGYYSVRGFRENYISADSGYYFRNKINFSVGSIILPLLRKENPGYFSHLNKISLEPFYDYGYAKYKSSNSGRDGRIAGAGLKTIFNSKYFTSSLTYSQAVNKSKLTNLVTSEKEDKLVYFEISANCC